MPTASDFRAAKRLFDELFEDARHRRNWLDSDWSPAVQGGRLAHAVGEAISASADMTRSIASVFEELSEECESRTDVCVNYQQRYDQYCRDLAAYQRDQLLDIREQTLDEPAFPEKPAPWVDVENGATL